MMRRIAQRILFLLKTIWHDLFGEEPRGEVRRTITGETTSDRLSALLDETQQHLDALRLEMANVVTHQQRIRQTWQERLAEIQYLNTAVDEALKAGRDDQAHGLQSQINRLQKGADEMAELVHACQEQATEIRNAVNSQQEQLDALRRRSLLLEDREHSLATLTEVFSAQQNLSRRAGALQTELTEWEEQIARREDKLAARRDWSK
jgi:chromosome segregation ATPase